MTRRILTAEDIAALKPGDRLEVDDETTITASARDLARRRGIEVVDTPGSVGAERPPPGEPATGESSPPGVPAEGIATTPTPPTAGKPAGLIVAAVGVNRAGILSEVTAAVGQLGGDIQDVSQRITGGYFNALLVVDIRQSEHNFAAFRDGLVQLSEPTDYVVTVIDERVFRAMHRV